jgi:hypothetical protein
MKKIGIVIISTLMGILVIVPVQNYYYLQGNIHRIDIRRPSLRGVSSRQITNGNNRENSLLLHSKTDESVFSISKTTAYIKRGPIKILNDSAFGSDSYNFSGTGTYNDPY